MRYTNILAIVTCALTALLTPSAHAALTYTDAAINSNHSVNDPAPDLVHSDTGANVQVGLTASSVMAFANKPNSSDPTAQFLLKPVGDDVFASSSLSAGELKTRASFTFGTNQNSVVMPVGTRNGSARGTADFADSFRTVDANNHPFLWSNGTVAKFQFGITGTSSIPSNVVNPTLGQFGQPAPGQPINLVMSFLQLQVFKAGTLELIDQANHFDFQNGNFSDFQALENQIQANQIRNKFWYLGNPIGVDVGSAEVITGINPTTPVTVTDSFAPNGDFDWILTQESTIHLDASLQNTTVLLDFSHTITTTYIAPDGAVTLSASGLFPGTEPLADLAIPEPTTALLMLLTAPLLLRRPRHHV